MSFVTRVPRALSWGLIMLLVCAGIAAVPSPAHADDPWLAEAPEYTDRKGIDQDEVELRTPSYCDGIIGCVDYFVNNVRVSSDKLIFSLENGPITVSTSPAAGSQKYEAVYQPITPQAPNTLGSVEIGPCDEYSGITTVRLPYSNTRDEPDDSGRYVPIVYAEAVRVQDGWTPGAVDTLTRIMDGETKDILIEGTSGGLKHGSYVISVWEGSYGGTPDLKTTQFDVPQCGNSTYPPITTGGGGGGGSGSGGGDTDTTKSGKPWAWLKVLPGKRVRAGLNNAKVDRWSHFVLLKKPNRGKVTKRHVWTKPHKVKKPVLHNVRKGKVVVQLCAKNGKCWAIARVRIRR